MGSHGQGVFDGKSKDETSLETNRGVSVSEGEKELAELERDSGESESIGRTPRKQEGKDQNVRLAVYVCSSRSNRRHLRSGLIENLPKCRRPST